MKNILVFLLLSLLLLSGLAMAQSHSFLDDRSVLNFNHNWGRVFCDTIHAKAASIDTFILSGNQAGYNLLVQSIDGAALLKLDGRWSNYWTIGDGNAATFSGGRIDTVFIKSGEADSSIVQMLWTSYN